MGYDDLISESLQENGISNEVENGDLSQNDDSPIMGGRQTPPTQQQVQEFEYTARGQRIKEPIDTILKRASQGYDYSQHMEDIKRQRQELDQYRNIYEAAQGNPEWWNQITSAYQNGQPSSFGQQQQNSDPNFQSDPNDPNSELISKLDSIVSEKMSKFDNFMQESLAEKNLRLRQEEDSKLEKEISDIRKQYSQIDFDSPDESGKSLEMRVLEHANQNGIKSFKTAYRDFYFDQITQKHESIGKEQAMKEIQKRTKLGLLGETRAPQKGISVTDHHGKSYRDLAMEALNELEINN